MAVVTIIARHSIATHEEVWSTVALSDFAADATLNLNNDRVKHRERIMPVIVDLFKSMTKDELMGRLDKAGIPFAPINKPADLFDDELNKAAETFKSIVY